MHTTVGSVQDFGNYATWPTNTVYVGMPCRAADAYGIPDGIFGKPWELKQHPRGWASGYVEYLCSRMLAQPSFEQAVRNLYGKTLLCWCTRKAARRGVEVPCHARILAEFVELLND